MKIQIVWTCGAPGCGKTHAIDTARKLVSVRDRPSADLLPPGWWWYSEQIVACPEHAGLLKAAEDAAFVYAQTVTKALNAAWKKVLERHPVPEHPEWLDRVWRDRQDNLR